MKYAIIHKDNVIITMEKFNDRRINSVLQVSLGYQDITVVPSDEQKIPWIINEDLKIVELL
jgi:hypothetical protein